MKSRTVVCILTVLLLLTVGLFSYAEEIGTDMVVANCEEWVSLRSRPEVSAERICKVKLGETVSNCRAAENGFWYCEYKSYRGYILEEYLEPASEKAVAVQMPSATTEPAEITYESFTRNHDIVLETTLGENSLVAQRLIRGSTEVLQVGLFNVSHETVWTFETEAEGAGEYPMCDAFIGGPAGSPCVMVYNAQIGLIRLNADTGEPEWTLSVGSIDLGSGIQHAVSNDGTMYIASETEPRLTAITRAGIVIWQSDAPSAAHPQKITIQDNQSITVAYSEPPTVNCFDTNGNLLSSESTETAATANTAAEQINITPSTLQNTVWELQSIATENQSEMIANDHLTGIMKFGGNQADLTLTQDENVLNLTNMPCTYTIGGLYDGCANTDWWGWLDCNAGDLRFTCYRQGSSWILEMQSNLNGATLPPCVAKPCTLKFKLLIESASAELLRSPMLWTDWQLEGHSIQAIASEDDLGSGIAREIYLVDGQLITGFVRCPEASGTGALVAISEECTGFPFTALTMKYISFGSQPAVLLGYTYTNAQTDYRGEDILLTVGGYSYLFHAAAESSVFQNYTGLLDRWRRSLLFTERDSAKLIANNAQ